MIEINYYSPMSALSEPLRENGIEWAFFNRHLGCAALEELVALAAWPTLATGSALITRSDLTLA
jgi:hypothetical protein